MEKKEKMSLASKVILLLMGIVFLFSIYKLTSTYLEYRKGDKEYEELKKEVVSVETVEIEDADEEEPGNQTVTKTVFKVDFDKLFSINPDTVAWIRFENPEKISYPVVLGQDNDKYLKTTFEGNQNSAGAIFADAGASKDFSDRNTFIYGHNMKNGTMFGQLRKYKTESFCKENPYFYIYTPEGMEMKYQVFAVCVVENDSRNYDKMYSDDVEYLEYIQYIRSKSICDIEVDVTAESQIVSLSTCTNVKESERLVIHGVKISEEKVGE